MSRAPVAIFDLDGTLIDAVMDIATSVNRRLVERGLAPLRREEATPFLGDGLSVFARRAFDLRRVTVSTDEIRACVHEYTRAPIVHTQLYPGVAETLGILSRAGWRLAVCTNKVELAADAILEQLGVHKYFDVVCGGDTVTHRKPDPRHLQQVLSRGGFEGHPAVMIGDNRVDVVAARGCGMPCVFAAWGYGTRDMAGMADSISFKFKELPGILESISK